MPGRLESFADYVQRRPSNASLIWFDTNVHVNYLGQHVDLRVDIKPEPVGRVPDDEPVAALLHLRAAPSVPTRRW